VRGESLFLLGIVRVVFYERGFAMNTKRPRTGLLPDDDRHRRHASAWRTTVEHWLRCQNLITVRQNQ
jgi:hypothetical protein